MTDRYTEMPIDDIETTYRRYFPIIRAKCARMLNNSTEAQDVAQETFTRLWANRKSISNRDAVLSWLYRTSTRLVIDRYRAGKRTENFDELDTTVDQAESSNDSRLQARQTLSLLRARIPRKEMEVAVLSRVDGMTHHEIATTVNSSERTVRRLLSRFDNRARQLLEESA